MNVWQSIPATSELTTDVQGARLDSLNVAKTKLSQNRLFFNAKKDQTAFFSGKTMNGDELIVFVIFNGNGQCQIGIRMNNPILAPIILQLVFNLGKAFALYEKVV